MTLPLRPDDLPFWMRPRPRVIDWGLLLVLAFSLIAIMPVMLRPGLPAGSQAEMVAYRAVSVARMVRSGTLYSRWSPELNLMYGSPLFNYIAPLPHYVAGYYQALTDTDPVSSVKVPLMLSLIAAAGGMYLFVRGRWGSASATVAALAYLFSTPLSYTLFALSGDLGLLMGMALLPWLLWMLDNLRRSPDRLRLGATIFILSLLLLTDSRLLPFVIPVVLAGLIRLPGAPPIPAVPSARRYLAAAALMSVLITAFYWLPALVERDQIRWADAVSDPNAGTVSLRTLIGTAERGGAFSKQIGIGVLLLAALGMIAVLHQTAEGWQQSRNALPFVVLGVLLALIATPPAQALWSDSTSFYALLPYHAVLAGTFCTAVVAGQAVRWAGVNRLGFLWLATLVALAVAPALVPFPKGEVVQEISEFSALRSELAGLHVGTFRTGTLLPATAEKLPPPLPNLISDLQLNTFQRLSPRVYAPAAKVSALEQGLLSSHFLIGVTQPIDVEYTMFNYPGWSASTGGKPLFVATSSQGLIRISLPSDAAELFVWLDSTPIRTVSWILSWSGILLVLFKTVTGRPFTQLLPDLDGAPLVPKLLSRQERLALLIILALASCFILLIN